MHGGLPQGKSYICSGEKLLRVTKQEMFMERITAREPARDPALSHPECESQFSHCCEIEDAHEVDLDMAFGASALKTGKR